MKFTPAQLEAALKTFTDFAMDSYHDGHGEECAHPLEFIRRCAEAMESMDFDDDTLMGSPVHEDEKWEPCSHCKGGPLTDANCGKCRGLGQQLKKEWEK